jgi:predicted negative regulator of RcsB-dependent stress response
MASNLDLQEQEQVEELKAFWKQYGNLITWLITLALAGFAAYNGWNWWQREQGVKAAALHEAFDQALAAGDADLSARAFGDLKERFPGTVFSAQAGLALARLQFDKGQADAARASLGWVAEKGSDEDLRSLARLRLAGLLVDTGSLDEALKQLDSLGSTPFAGLAQDRRGDILLTQGKKAEAVREWQAAWKAMDARQDYRRVVEAKLNSAGATPPEEVTDKLAGGAK